MIRKQLILWLTVLLMPLGLKAQNTIADVIKKDSAALYYPRSVERFYKQNGYQLAWIATDTVKTHAWDAMLLLDCVLQYGLNHNDYHPGELLYGKLDILTKQKGGDYEKAEYDVLLTDAMIRFINDLHFGKLNPQYSAIALDKGNNFQAHKLLFGALHSKDFISAIEDVQPKSKLYFDLQNHMRLLTGQLSGDCYVIPPVLIRKMAINMERLRWISTTNKQVHLTLVVKEGTVINYKDIYKQDKSLERALYNEGQPTKKYLKPGNINPGGL